MRASKQQGRGEKKKIKKKDQDQVLKGRTRGKDQATSGPTSPLITNPGGEEEKQNLLLHVGIKSKWRTFLAGGGPGESCGAITDGDNPNLRARSELIRGLLDRS